MSFDDLVLAELQERADDETQHWMMLGEKDCIDLAAGIVPRVVQAMARTLLEDLDTISRRNAAKPVHQKKKRKKPVGEVAPDPAR
jgi:hypothetical protein